MPDPHDDFFSHVDAIRGRRIEQQQESTQASWEHTLVKQILTTAGLSAEELAGLVREHRDEHEHGSISLDWFLRQYPAFPLNLVASKVEYTHTVTLGELFYKFKKTKIWKAYTEIIDTLDTGERDEDAPALGMIFRIVQRTVVLHNFSIASEMATDAEHVRLTVAIGKPPRSYTLEPLSQLLKAVGGDWIKAGY